MTLEDSSNGNSSKRRAEDDPPVDNDNDEEDDETMSEEIDVDFVFSSLTDLDFHGLKTLLRQGFGPDAEALPLSALAEALLAQQGLGTAVKVDDTLDPYAVMSVLPLHGVIHLVLSFVKLLADRYMYKEYPRVTCCDRLPASQGQGSLSRSPGL